LSLCLRLISFSFSFPSFETKVERRCYQFRRGRAGATISKSLPEGSTAKGANLNSKIFPFLSNSEKIKVVKLLNQKIIEPIFKSLKIEIKIFSKQQIFG
jgi:hypothetical protein